MIRLRRAGPIDARLCAAALLLTLTATLQPAAADGVVVEKIYLPYVQPLETEIEARSILQDDPNLQDLDYHVLGVARSLNDRVSTELYAVAIRRRGEGLSLDIVEGELRWQLTEQGEYAVDWGLLFELERNFGVNAWEATSTVIAVRELGRWVATANLALIYEWGSGVATEFETSLRTQARYRLSERVEPGVEMHLGQDTAALGPMVTGLVRLGIRRQLRWHVGVYPGLSSASPDTTAMFLLEYEF